MNADNQYLWKSKKDEYVLIKSSENCYSVFNIKNNGMLIIEDGEEAKFVINQMKQSGNRIIRLELLKYLLDNRPIPILVEIRTDKAIYRCPDTGEELELNLECTSNIEPRFDLAIRWTKDIPLAEQIVYLKRIYPDILKSTPDLLHLARNYGEYVFAECLSHFQVDRIISEARKDGLNIYVISK